MTFAAISGLFYFVKAKEIELEGKDKSYKRVLLYVTYSKSLPQALVEVSPKKYEALQTEGLKPGKFLFIQGSFELIQNDKNPMAEYISEPQKVAVRATPTIKASMVILQPEGCTAAAMVEGVAYITSDLQGTDNRGKSHMVFKDNGLSILNFSGSVRTPYKAAEGDQYPPSTFLPLTAFGNKAEFLYNYFKKKDFVAVQCRLDLNSWDKKEVNQDTLEEYDVKKYNWKLVINEATFAAGGKSNKTESSNSTIEEVSKSDDNTSWETEEIPF